MRLCLDTNAYSALGSGNVAITQLLEMAEEIIVPSMVVGELMFGFLKGSRFNQNEANLKRFLAQDGVLFQPVTMNISERYGYVKAALSQKGRIIPENDIWIAATALETGTRLISYDTHFDNIGGLVRIAP